MRKMSNIREAIERKAKELFFQVDSNAEVSVEMVYDVVIRVVWPEGAGAKRLKREKFYEQQFNLLKAFSGALIDFRFVEGEKK